LNAQEAYTYRDSHKYEGKGAEYESYYGEPWQKFLWAREQKVLSAILATYFVDRDIHLLDFACGTGRITSFLEQRVTTSTGVDVSDSMLAIARRKLKQTELIEADITADNPLQGRTFNLITAFRFFVNAEPQLRAAAIKALAPLLAEDGYFVFNNHQNYGCPWIKLRCWRHRQLGSRGIFNVMSADQMRELVAGVGLEIVDVRPIGFFHPPKIPISLSLNRAMDGLFGRFKSLAYLSESPIAVCRWPDGVKSPG